MSGLPLDDCPLVGENHSHLPHHRSNISTMRRCLARALRQWIRGCLAIGILGAAACTDSTSPRPGGENDLSDAWSRYKTLSTQHAAADRAVVDSELKAIGQSTTTRAAYTDADFKIDGTMTDAWFATSAAAAMADAILSYQTPTGGWSKHIDYTAGPRKPGQSFYGETDSWDYIATIDNGATTTEITFLARANKVRPSSQYRAAVERGLEYLVLAQQPTGCWPQVYPLMGGYHDAATYNDDAIVHVLSLLRDVGNGGLYAFVSSGVASHVSTALTHGIDCVVASQIVVVRNEDGVVSATRSDDAGPDHWPQLRAPRDQRPGERRYCEFSHDAPQPRRARHRGRARGRRLVQADGDLWVRVQRRERVPRAGRCRSAVGSHRRDRHESPDFRESRRGEALRLRSAHGPTHRLLRGLGRRRQRR